MAKPQKREVPAYMVTLGDMWSLLLTFFIMIVALSEVDATKFKKIQGSMKDAFGYQKVFLFHEAPKGTSLLKTEQASLSQEALNSGLNPSAGDPDLQALQSERDKSRKLKEKNDKKIFKRNLASVYSNLRPEIKKGLIEISKKNKDVIIRVSEKASFQSGSATLTNSFPPLVQKISKALSNVSGNIRIAGHTDNRSLKSDRFKTNWELSSARAAAVGQALIDSSSIAENRFVLEAYGSTQPYVDNSSPYNRAKNRRVEIIITKP